LIEPAKPDFTGFIQLLIVVGKSESDMRLLIVSNRLPVVLKRKNSEFLMEKSPGGLVSGLSDYLASLGDSSSGPREYIWLGWPGISIAGKHHEKVRTQLREEFNSWPVFLSEKLMEQVYLGFCNKTIWPIFHYFPNYAEFNREFWTEYKKVNEIFRDEILQIIKPGDIVWVHDYHLMLLPSLLREEISNPIGFFLHIPFPTYEVFRLLRDESRRGILNGLLGADLVGFHTHDYSQYFLRCVRRILGIENHMGKIDLPGRMVRVDTFPMGVDYNKFNKLQTDANDPALPDKKGVKMILSVDRQDYSKGILHRLRGFELFLRSHPEWHGKVCLSMIVVPSRIGVDSYQEIKSSLDEWVGHINGEYGNFNWTPVIYQYTSLSHETLISLFRMSDVALLTPLRDGMNLIAKEFIASLNDKKGVLILSEFTGASKELIESIIINPNNIEEIAQAIHAALNVPVRKQVENNQAMQARLKRYDVRKWASTFVSTLTEIRSISEHSFRKKLLNGEFTLRLLENFQFASGRILIFNYDGTLVPLSEKTIRRPSGELMNYLREIREQSGSDIVILSGRTREELESWLGDLPVNLAAEHGSWIREHHTREWAQLKPISNDWKQDILPILEVYTDRLPGARVIEKDYSVSWHYHKSDIEQASYVTRELTDHLINLTANMDIQVFQGNRALEITSSGVNKGDLARHWLGKDEYDFVLAIGAGWTDELLFRALPENAWSIKVGITQTEASYVIRGHNDVMALLEKLASA
jgi:trehalose 6-phosphate synthase/phosphatase